MISLAFYVKSLSESYHVDGSGGKDKNLGRLRQLEFVE